MAAVTFIKAVMFIGGAVMSIKGAMLFIKGAVTSIEKTVMFISEGGLAVKRLFKIARVKINDVKRVNKYNLRQ